MTHPPNAARTRPIHNVAIPPRDGTNSEDRYDPIVCMPSEKANQNQPEADDWRSGTVTIIIQVRKP